MRTETCFQPNRMFIIRGKIVGINTELKFTRVILSVHNYFSPNWKPDELTVYFKGESKRDADTMIFIGHTISVTGDIVVKNGNIFFNGKVIEAFKTAELVQVPKVKYIEPDDISYDGAF